MVVKKAVLSEVTLDATGIAQSLSVAVREADGSALSSTLYDSAGAVIVGNPVSDNAGLLEVYSHARSVQIKPSGASAWTNTQFRPDPTGQPIDLHDFAGANSIDTGVYSATAAIRAAVVRAQITGQRIHARPGTYLVDDVITLPSNVWIEGEGTTTVFKHADYTFNNINHGVFQVLSLATRNVRLSSFKIDGNYAGNHGDTTGFGGTELIMGGTDCLLEDILITNFNCWAFLPWGERLRVYRCRAEGVAPVSYSPEYTGTYLGTLVGLTIHLDLASIHGFITSPQSSCDGLYMEDCSVIGTRATGMYVAGTSVINVRPSIGNCHRGYHPDVNSGGAGSSGGPQLGFPDTSTAGTVDQAVPPTRMVVISPMIAVTSGPSANGIEIGSANGLEILDPQIEGASGNGIALFKSSATSSHIRVVGGLIKNVAGVGISVADVTDVTLDGTDLVSCTTGLSTTGTADRLSYTNVGFNGNTTNWAMTATPTVLQSYGHRVANGDIPPIRHEGTPTTTGTQSLGALPIARVPVVAAASAADLVNGDFAFHDITGAAVTLGIGQWAVTGTLVVNRDAGVNDAAAVFAAGIVVGTATAVISLPSSYAEFGPIAAASTGTGSQTWTVKVTVAGTIKLQVKKGAGTGSSAVRMPMTTISAIYLGNP